jgi:hypothetical protein
MVNFSRIAMTNALSSSTSPADVRPNPLTNAPVPFCKKARSSRAAFQIPNAASHLPLKPINAELTLPFFPRTLAAMASQKKLLERSFHRFAVTGNK